MFSENGAVMDEMFRRWRDNPNAVDATWQRLLRRDAVRRQARRRSRDRRARRHYRRPPPPDRRRPARLLVSPGRAPGSPHRPARRLAAAAAPAPGARTLRPHRGRPRQDRRRLACSSASTGPIRLRDLIDRAPRDLLPHDRRRVHAHPTTPTSAAGSPSGWSRPATAPTSTCRQKCRILIKLH